MKDILIRNIQAIFEDPSIDEHEITIRVKKLIYENENHQANLAASKRFAVLLPEFLKSMEKSEEKTTMIPSGFNQMDNEFGGFVGGELAIIGARPGMGKTQLMVNLALQMAKSKPVLYCSCDLSESLLLSRFIASLSKISMRTLLQKKFLPEEIKQLQEVEKQVFTNDLFINVDITSIGDLKAVCKKHIEEDGVHVIFVDYLQLLGTSKYKNNREQEISIISRELKNIAKEYNVCMIVASQLSRAVETRTMSRRPILSDLRDSGAIEQDADKVIFLYRPEYYGLTTYEDGSPSHCIATLIIAKNRNGSLGEMQLERDENFTFFKEIIPEDVKFEISSAATITFSQKISSLDDFDF